MKIAVEIEPVRTYGNVKKYKVSLRGPLPRSICIVYLTKEQLTALRQRLNSFFVKDPFL